jgi:hypothetical protein
MQETVLVVGQMDELQQSRLPGLSVYIAEESWSALLMVTGYP